MPIPDWKSFTGESHFEGHPYFEKSSKYGWLFAGEPYVIKTFQFFRFGGALSERENRKAVFFHQIAI